MDWYCQIAERVQAQLSGAKHPAKKPKKAKKASTDEKI